MLERETSHEGLSAKEKVVLAMYLTQRDIERLTGRTNPTESYANDCNNCHSCSDQGCADCGSCKACGFCSDDYAPLPKEREH